MTEENQRTTVTRRSVLVGAASTVGMLTAGCLPSGRSGPSAALVSEEHYKRMYAGLSNERFPVPPVKLKRVKPEFLRREVAYNTKERVGTVIVDTKNFHLHLVEPDGRAMRYGVGLGRAGFDWSGAGNIAWKRKWPTWTPPAEMIERDPRLAQWSAAKGGMKPGLKNPLGARALYIFQNGEDTLYRLHGTPDARSIGKAVSSGCVRLLNHDVIDLYERVKPGAKIIVV